MNLKMDFKILGKCMWIQSIESIAGFRRILTLCRKKGLQIDWQLFREISRTANFAS